MTQPEHVAAVVADFEAILAAARTTQLDRKAFAKDAAAYAKRWARLSVADQGAVSEQITATSRRWWARPNADPSDPTPG